MSSANTIDMHYLEDEINAKFSNNSDYDIKDLQLFVELTPYSFLPISFTYDSKNTIHIDPTDKIAGLPIYMGSKHQFIHKQINIEYDTYNIELDEDFKTAWDQNKFVIFQNGYLMNNNLFTFIIPNFDNDYLKKKIYSTAVFKTNAIVDIFYIENDDFTNLPISKDMYLKGIKYTAQINDDTILPIPYPNKNMVTGEESFYLFNDKGRVLNPKIDYVISNDGLYLTLIGDNILKRANINYLIFAFPQFPSSPDYTGNAEDELDNEEEYIISGYPMFRYAFSTDDNRSDLDRSGIIRFSPEFENYTLTKSNFILFGNGVWIDPVRYDVYGNNAIIFNNEEDIAKAHLVKYTMVILNDTTDHTEFEIPGKYKIIQLTADEKDDKYFTFPKMGELYKSFLLFKGTTLIPSEYYNYYEESNSVELLSDTDSLNDDRIISALFLAINTNNTKQDSIFKQVTFDCNPVAFEGTKMPHNIINQAWDNDCVLLFLNGRYIRPDEYVIKDNTIYLDNSYFSDASGNMYGLEHHTFTAIFLEGLYNYNQTLLPEEKVQEIENKKAELRKDAQGGAMFVHCSQIDQASHGIIRFTPQYREFTVTKRHSLLFANGKLITPDRYEIYNNTVIYLNNDADIQHCSDKEFGYEILTDSVHDENFNPSSMTTKFITATEDNQTTFNLPNLHKRFRTFIMFDSHGNFISKSENYIIDDINNTLTFTNRISNTGDTYTLIYMDSFTRIHQESKFHQFTFPCNLSGTTLLPGNLYYDNFDQNLMILFLNGSYLSPSKYTIHENMLFLDPSITFDPTLTYNFTVVWIATILSSIKEYDYKIPTMPLYPYMEYVNEGHAYLTFSYSHNVTTERTASGILPFSPKFKAFSISKSNTLMFSKDGRWVHPSYYELYTNDTVFFTNFLERTTKTDDYIMTIFSDRTSDDGLIVPTSFVTKEVTIEEYNVTEVPVPQMADQFASYLIFFNENLISADKYTVNNKVVTFKDNTFNRNDKLYFVFLNSATSLEIKTVFIQESIDLNDTSVFLPLSLIDEDFDKGFALIFVDGKFIDPRDYEINNNILTFTNSEIVGEKINVVYMISFSDENELEMETRRKPDGIEDGFVIEYSYSVEKPIDQRTDLGLIQFIPSFTDYQLNKNNFLLFSRGIWISPTRFELLTNSNIQFLDNEDKESSDWGHYTMAILTETVSKDENYHPVSFDIRSVKATVNNQKEFRIPYVGEKATFIVFKGSLLIPLTDETRVEINENESKLILKDDEDAAKKGRDLIFVFLSDSSTNDDRVPLFIQETIMAAPDPTTGTLIPSSWYTKENFDDRFMMLFLGGMYLSPAMYEIQNKRIYLKDAFHDLLLGPNAFEVKHKNYTAVFISSYASEAIISEETISHVNKDEEEYNHEEEQEPEVTERIVPEDDGNTLTGLMFEFYESSDLPVVDRDNNDNIQFRDTFTSYNFDKENILLFDNSTWIDPERYDILDNNSIQVHNDIDKEAANWSHSTIAIINNKEAIEYYGDAYIRPKYMIKRVTIKELDNFEFPTVGNEYQSFMIFYNSRILPVFDESRYYIDEFAHKINILNIEDYIEIGKVVTFVFLNANSNTDQDIRLLQESFKCDGDVTAIPRSIYLYEDQVFTKNRMLLFINGTFMHQDRYRVHDNKIYTVDYMPKINPYTYTIVYLVVNEDNDNESVIDDTFDHPLDDIIFERAYAKPYIPIPVDKEESKISDNDLIFAYCDGTKDINNFVQFSPTFAKYRLFKTNTIVFADGDYLPVEKYSLLTNDTLSFPHLTSEEVSHYNDLSMVILANNGSYETGFKPSYLVHHTVVCENYAENTFDIMVQDDWKKPKSFIVFNRFNKLLTNYEIDWRRRQIYITDRDDELDPGYILNFVFLDSRYNKNNKYNVFTQHSFKSKGADTLLPIALRGIENNKMMVFVNREYWPTSEYNVYNNHIYSNRFTENDVITIVAIVESSNTYREVEERMIKR